MTTKIEQSVKNKTIAMIIPCYNEELTVARVITDTKKYLPEANIYVIDNNSTDNTAKIAKENGAEIIFEPRPGKGFAVQRAMERLDYDVYGMVDGDDTYSLETIKDLVRPVMDGHYDMIIGSRLAIFENDSFRQFHVLGNRLVRGLINRLFRCKLTDIMSGYRIYNKEIAKKLPVVSKGFEVETEMTISLLSYGFRLKEIDICYKSRMKGSFSKLNTFKDGFKVLWTIFNLFKNNRPLTFFGTLALGFFFFSLIFGMVVVVDYFDDLFVEHVPLAILSTSLFLCGLLFFLVGVTLHSIVEKHNQVMCVLKKI
ncbi:MAG: glycosyl transferase [Candidatus Margulisiibacteriota bacterium]|nr:MAG: hypothetical protein A2X43_02535 [Candidatus Margulisbacteria bacterium GWD2_39_127]PZM83938.1 MAG: glycosyl transferase [Candidatus Margulisiibacteriota bacterium]HAR64184.1 glycosyl transferase [Candidatus Margulisiibacteriota bacterium]HCY36206.1 glycosyl transferase [Candidatus Margulisiibacteriota bacterium]